MNRTARSPIQVPVVPLLIALISIAASSIAAADEKARQDLLNKTPAEWDAELLAAFPPRQAKFVETTRGDESLEVQEQTEALMTAKDVHGLEALAKKFIASDKTLPTGLTRLEFFHHRLQFPNEETLQAIEPRMDLYRRWSEAYPKSVSALTARIELQTKHAWDARGSGFVGTVTEEGAKQFAERLAPAKAWIESAAELTIDDPQFYAAAINFVKSTGGADELVDAWIEAAAKATPLVPDPFRAAAEYYLPRWYGSPELLTQYALDVYEATSNRCGAEMYAEIVYRVGRYHGMTTFADFPFSFELVEQGYLDRAKRAPKNLRSACQLVVLARFADRRDVVRRLTEHIDGNLMKDVLAPNQYFEYYAWGQRPADQIGKTIFELEVRPEAVYWDRRGEAILFVDREGLKILDLKTAAVTGILGIEDAISLDATADQRFLAVGTRRGKLMLLNFVERKIDTLHQTKESYNDVRFSKDGKWLAARYSSNATNQMQLWDVSTKKLTVELAAGRIGLTHSHQYFSPDGSKWVGGFGIPEIFKLPDGGPPTTATSDGSIQPFKSIASPSTVVMSPGGDLICMSGEEKLRVWSGADLKFLKEIPLSPAAVRSAIFTPDGKRLLTGLARMRVVPGQPKRGAPSEIVMWNARDLTAVEEFKGHTSPINALALSPDGKRMVSASEDSTIRIWTLPE